MKPSKNKSLAIARRAKKDEFYTQLSDIENELQHYKIYFKGKRVLCNCDDPKYSKFYDYFNTNFYALGLKELITSYKDTQGNGDFRSKEAIALLARSDVVVTNPPFSLFREYIAQLIEHDKKFVIVGPLTAVHYRDIFQLFKHNLIWLGYGFRAGNAYFKVPNSTKQYTGGVYNNDTGLVKFRNACWFTNINIKKRHADLRLSESYYENKTDYPKYDNYQAINVDKIKLIPKDYEGVMGVPDTFLQHYNPAQFELIGNLGNGKVAGTAKYSRMLIRRNTTQPQTYLL